MEQLEEFLARNTRDILAPVVPGQNKITGRFQSGTTGTPPPAAHVEDASAPTPTNPPLDADDDSDESDTDEREEVDAEDEGEGDGEDTPPSSDAPPVVADTSTSTPASTPPELIEVRPGEYMTREAISAALASRAGGTGEAESTVPPVASPAPADVPLPTIPQELLDDPELGPFARVLQQQQSALDEQRKQLAFVSDIAVARAQEELQSRVTAGIHQFRDDKTLSDDELAEVNRVAANLNVMPSLASGIDPITGETVPRDPQRAAYRALEIAYWQMPKYREQEVQRATAARAKDSRRKQKLAGVSGGSGSVPRTTSVPTDRRGRELAAVSELREMMSPGSEE